MLSVSLSVLCRYPADGVCSRLTGGQRPVGRLDRIHEECFLVYRWRLQLGFLWALILAWRWRWSWWELFAFPVGGAEAQLRGEVGFVARSAPRVRAGSWAGVAGTRAGCWTGTSPQSPLQGFRSLLPSFGWAALAGRWCVSSLRRALSSARAPSKTLPSLIEIPFLIGWRKSERAAAPIPHAALATVTSACSCGKGILNLFILMISGGLVAGTPH